MSKWKLFRIIDRTKMKKKENEIKFVKEKETNHVDRLIYCFQESEPDSLPPPVCFSPPKAPPISAPLVGILTLTYKEQNIQ